MKLILPSPSVRSKIHTASGPSFQRAHTQKQEVKSLAAVTCGPWHNTKGVPAKCAKKG